MTFRRGWTALAAVLPCFLAAHAEPLEELKSLSGLSGLDARKLQAGEVISARGTQGNFARGVYLESAYYLKAPPATVGETLLHWNPAKYPESEVSQYLTYTWPGHPELFKPFQPIASRKADRFIIEASASASAELHLSPAERAAAAAPGSWPSLLFHRSEEMASAGGLAAVSDYRAGDVTINALHEYRSLLKMAPAIAAHFKPLIDDKSLVPGATAAAEEIVPYLEESLVRDHTSWCLGVLAAQKTPGAWQVIDCTYYTADTYFMSLSLYELRPWASGTLVWQVAYISAPFRPYLAHVDKVFAGREMAKDSAKSVEIFRRELEAHPR